MIELLRRHLRTRLPGDISLLGWPGPQFRHVHIKHLICYGWEVYIRDLEYAEARYLRWVKEGYTLTFKHNWRGSLYIYAKEP
jgi:hypothetical protein